MNPKLRVHTAVALFLVIAAALSAASIAARTTRVPAKPVIGLPVTVPAQPHAGKRFTVLFRVTRIDTGKPLMRGKMVCDPSVAGKVIPHAESFKQGTARLSFVVPTDAAAKLLTVKLTIKTGSQSATRLAAFRILQGEVKPLVSIGDVSAAEGTRASRHFRSRSRSRLPARRASRSTSRPPTGRRPRRLTTSR